MRRHLLLISLVLAATLCPAGNSNKDKNNDNNNNKERFLRPGPIHLDRSGKKWADKTLRHMSTEEKVGQVFGIKVRLDPREGQLRPGMAADVTFPQAR